MSNTWTAEEQAEHRKLWVEALRSGKYAQTQMQLRDEDTFCCLGVACDLYLKSGEAPDYMRWDDDLFVFLDDRLHFDPPLDKFSVSISNILPDVVKDWLGLKSNCGTFGPWGSTNGTQQALTTMNDRGADFCEIADFIESEPEGLIS